MPKIVINVCYGGFSVSSKALEEIAKRKGITLYKRSERFGDKYYTSPTFEDGTFYSCYDFKRTDPDLIAVVEELSEASWGDHAELKIVKVPADVKWYIHDYDGIECVNEEHRSWS